MASGLRSIKIKLSGEADMDKAVDNVQGSLKGVEKAGRRASDSFDKAGQAADDVDGKAMGFRDTLTGVEDTMKGVGEIAKGNLFEGLFTLGMGVGDLASGFANFLIPGLKGMSKQSLKAKGALVKQKVATNLVKGAQKALNAVMRANPLGIIITIIMILVGAIIVLWKENETFRKIVKKVWRAIKRAIKAVVDWLVNTAWPFIKRVWDNIVDGARRMKDRVVDIWNTVKDKIGGFVDGITGFLSGMWDGMVSAGKSAINTLISIANTAIGGLNTMIDLANNVPGIDFPLIPQIPHLAKGGIVTGPTLAMIGEKGDEAVIPLDRANEFGMGGGPQFIENHIHIGDEVTRVVRTEIKGHDRDLRRSVGAVA